MRNAILAWIPVLLILLMGPASFAGEDTALIQRVGKFLEPRGKLATLTKALGQKPEELRDIGFDCRWARYALYGDALTLHIDVVTWRDWVAGIQVRSLGDEPDLAKEIRRAWGDRVQIEKDGILLRNEKAVEMRRLRRSVWRGLGAPPKDGVSQATRDAVAGLSDPLHELTFGHICYEDGSPPAARRLATKLWLAGSPPALRTVLVGANPEGRLYAAEMLLRLDLEGDLLGKIRREIITKVLASDLKLRTCDGCEVADRRAAGLVSAKTVRASVLCRILAQASDRSGPYTKHRITIYRDGGRMAQRMAPPMALACIPRIDRALLADKELAAIEAAVKAGKGVEVRDGMPTFVIEPGAGMEAPKAIRDLLAALPKSVR